jgi:hypothetical protein
MLNYPRLHHLLNARQPVDYEGRVVPVLVAAWLDDYDARTPKSEVVTVKAQGFSYLFDVANERLIAAWGVSRGRAAHARDGSRMRGHPLGGPPLFHRGHAIAHRLGGGLDINLVPQLGSVNTGAFRKLENEAIAKPGSLYFTYWIYGSGTGQRPSGVEQGLLVPGAAPRVSRHAN